MTTLGYILITCLVLATHVTSLINVADVACGVTTTHVRTPRIKGGSQATQGEFPWLVSIRVSGAQSAHYCGGSLLHKRFVLTAAHCIHWNSPKYVAVVAGEHDMKDQKTDRQILAVKEILSHKNFSKGYINDIALLELAEEVRWTPHVKPVCLPDREADGVKDLMDVTVAGWGKTDELANGGVAAQVLQKVVVRVLPKTKCEEWYNLKTTPKRRIHFYDSHLCAGYEAGGKDACQGDSGGPLVTPPDASGSRVCVGVVSAGSGCGRPKYPGLYTRVSRFVDWILDHMRSKGVNV